MGIPVPVSTYFRVIDPADYDTEKGEFKSFAFQVSSDGISVVHRECAITASGSICAHIPRFYAGRTKTPGVFWNIPTAELPDGCLAVQSDSTSGDRCHYTLTGWPKSAARRKIKSLTLGQFSVCDNDGPRPLTKIDLTELFMVI